MSAQRRPEVEVALDDVWEYRTLLRFGIQVMTFHVTMVSGTWVDGFFLTVASDGECTRVSHRVERALMLEERGWYRVRPAVAAEVQP